MPEEQKSGPSIITTIVVSGILFAIVVGGAWWYLNYSTEKIASTPVVDKTDNQFVTKTPVPDSKIPAPNSKPPDKNNVKPQESYADQYAREEAEAKKEHTQFIDQFFDKQAKGREVESMFCNKIMAASLYAVRSWTLVDSNVIDKRNGMYTYRVDSSTKGGIQITNLWNISVDQKPGSTEYCISLFFENK